VPRLLFRPLFTYELVPPCNVTDIFGDFFLDISAETVTGDDGFGKISYENYARVQAEGRVETLQDNNTRRCLGHHVPLHTVT
jgi:hypothetical protein